MTTVAPGLVRLLLPRDAHEAHRVASPPEGLLVSLVAVLLLAGTLTLVPELVAGLVVTALVLQVRGAAVPAVAG